MFVGGMIFWLVVCCVTFFPGQVELMFADLTQPSGENMGDQPDVEYLS